MGSGRGRCGSWCGAGPTSGLPTARHVHPRRDRRSPTAARPAGSGCTRRCPTPRPPARARGSRRRTGEPRSGSPWWSAPRWGRDRASPPATPRPQRCAGSGPAPNSSCRGPRPVVGCAGPPRVHRGERGGWPWRAPRRARRRWGAETARSVAPRSTRGCHGPRSRAGTCRLVPGWRSPRRRSPRTCCDRPAPRAPGRCRTPRDPDPGAPTRRPSRRERRSSGRGSGDPCSDRSPPPTRRDGLGTLRRAHRAPRR